LAGGTSEGVAEANSSLFTLHSSLKAGDIDLLTYSTPCQSISHAGKRAGIAKGSGTRSSILWNTADAIEALRPKILMQENVAALVNQENKPHFDQWRGVLSDLGYDSDYRVLNAKDFGVPQNRERVFCLSWRRDMGLPHAFPWPQPVPLTRTIADVLEPDADPRYFLRPESVTAFLQKNESEQMIYVTTDHKPTGAEIDHILCENEYNV
jgi:DNA (cytosine-5)-methyltransferase 1